MYHELTLRVTDPACIDPCIEDLPTLKDSETSMQVLKASPCVLCRRPRLHKLT